MSKAVVFFADGTEECEALLVIDLLRRAKVEVTVASAMGRKELVSSHKIHLTADALAEDVDYSDVDLVVLPGGIPGTPNLAANKTVTETCKAFAAAGKKVAAICAAPSVLASLGLLCISHICFCLFFCLVKVESHDFQKDFFIFVLRQSKDVIIRGVIVFFVQSDIILV